MNNNEIKYRRFTYRHQGIGEGEVEVGSIISLEIKKIMVINS